MCNRSEVVMVVKIPNVGFWVMTPCSLVGGYQPFKRNILLEKRWRHNHQRSSVGITMGYGPDGLSFNYRQGQEIFLYSTAQRPALESIQPSI
jgi:hypothetical protein